MEKDTENISDNISENSNVRGAAAVDVRFSRSNSLNSASGENGLKEGGYAKRPGYLLGGDKHTVSSGAYCVIMGDSRNTLVLNQNADYSSTIENRPASISRAVIGFIVDPYRLNQLRGKWGGNKRKSPTS
jgi:hypothetical protein